MHIGRNNPRSHSLQSLNQLAVDDLLFGRFLFSTKTAFENYITSLPPFFVSSICELLDLSLLYLNQIDWCSAIRSIIGNYQEVSYLVVPLFLQPAAELKAFLKVSLPLHHVTSYLCTFDPQNILSSLSHPCILQQKVPRDRSRAKALTLLHLLSLSSCHSVWYVCQPHGN